MQARNLSPVDVMKAVESANKFLPTGEAIIGSSAVWTIFLDSNAMYKQVEHMAEIPLRTEHGTRAYVGDVAVPQDDALIQTTVVRVGDAAGPSRKQVYIPMMRQQGASTFDVINQLKAKLPQIEGQLS